MFGPIKNVIFDVDGTLLDVSSAKPFKGVEEVLATLKQKNIHMTVFTGRDRQSCYSFFKQQGWIPTFFADSHFVICGDDDFDPKPSGAAILELLKRFNLNAAETLMVGDNLFDMQAGRYAGVKTAAVLWDLSSAEGGSERSKFRAQWNKWPTDVCDLRLTDPSSLASWILDGPGKTP